MYFGFITNTFVWAIEFFLKNRWKPTLVFITMC
jgi:hypothetical protein